MMSPETMQFETLLMQVAQPRFWPVGRDVQGNITVTVPNVKPGRSQVVYITYGKDSEGASMAFFWSICAETTVIRDPMAILRANFNLSYGCYTIREPHLIVQEGLFLGGADGNTIAKIIWHVAKYADAYEEALFGMQQRF
jgi:hypothetical protein